MNGRVGRKGDQRIAHGLKVGTISTDLVVRPDNPDQRIAGLRLYGIRGDLFPGRKRIRGTQGRIGSQRNRVPSGLSGRIERMQSERVGARRFALGKAPGQLATLTLFLLLPDFLGLQTGLFPLCLDFFFDTDRALLPFLFLGLLFFITETGRLQFLELLLRQRAPHAVGRLSGLKRVDGHDRSGRIGLRRNFGRNLRLVLLLTLCRRPGQGLLRQTRTCAQAVAGPTGNVSAGSGSMPDQRVARRRIGGGRQRVFRRSETIDRIEKNRIGPHENRIGLLALVVSRDYRIASQQRLALITPISGVIAESECALLLVDDLHITEHQGILRPGAIYDRIGPHLLGLGHDIRAIGKRIPVVAPVVDAPVCRQKLVLRVPDI